MSKISLQPNASGAGTFSIVAPDSNTNRTLTLPDESGAVLSDSSTIDSNNLQPDVYKQDNILGTVSESNGVPTGAIIESGSNANGEFVKYADGTMIARVQSSTSNVNAGSKVTFSEQPWPVAFSLMSDRRVFCTARSNTAPAAADLIIGVGSGSSDGVTSNTVVTTTVKNTSSSTRNARPNIFGFGRWY